MPQPKLSHKVKRKKYITLERSSKNINDSADKRQTEIECDRQKEMLAALFNLEEQKIHHYSLCKDTCTGLSLQDPQKSSKDKHRFKHGMIIDPSTSYSERTGLWWLVYKESDGMYCLICKRHCHFKAEIYCTKPATRYRKEAILDHVRSKNHKAAELEELVQKISPFEKDLQEKKQYADEVYDAAFKSMYWIAKEELPNNKFVSLINLIERLGVQKMKHFNHRGMGSIREMMITIGDVIQEDLVLQELRDAKTFGLMIDDVTDITNTEQCVCFVQYVSKDGMPKVQFLFIEDALKNSNSVNAETLVNIVHDKMDSFGLERRKLGSLCTDGASVMIAKNGVAGKLKNENPQLINIHCICHKLALACVQSNDDVQVIKQTHLYLTQLWKYFEHSAKRTALYLKVQEETKKIQLTEQAKKIVGKKLKKACTTRWLSFDHSIEACHADILSILNTLNILGEKDTAVYGLLQRMKGYSFIASLYVLRSVLPILSSLSKVFQSGTIDFSHICPSLQFTIDKLKEIADNQTPIVELKKDLSEGGRLSELQLNATENQIEKTSSMLRKYTESLISNIEKRFSDSLEILKAFDIFNPFPVPERETLEFTVYGNELIETMINHFFKDLEESKKEEIRVEWKKLKYHFLQ